MKQNTYGVRRRKWTGGILAVCLAVSAILVSPFSRDTVKADEKEGDIFVEDQGYWYRELEGGSIEITAFVGPPSSGEDESDTPVEITVPLVLDGKNVVRIGDYAYNGNTGYCRDRIKKITVPEGIISIGHAAFRGCTKLEQLILPDSLTSIENYMIEYCSLTEITIPKGVTRIEEWAFHGCETLTAIHVAADNPAFASQDGVLYNKNKNTLLRCPQGVSGAFTIPENITTVGNYAFGNCKNLTDIKITMNVGSIGTSAFQSCQSLKAVTVPGSVKTIGDSAFDNCSGLRKITLEEGIETICSGSFRTFYLTTAETEMEAVVIPASVTSLETDIFDYCDLPALHVAAGNQKYVSEDGILYDKNKTVLLLCPRGKIQPDKVRITVPDTVQSIAENAFDHNSGRTKHVTLVCYEGSPAQAYADEYGMAFEASRKAYTFTITFDANGGTNTGTAALTGTEGKTIGDMGLELPTATRMGYDFLGWYTARTGGTEVTAETRFTGNQTVYAHWEPQSSSEEPTAPAQPDNTTQPAQPDDPAQQEQTIRYTVTFHKNGGSKVSKTSITVAKGRKIGKLPTAQRKGYAFKGWYTAKKGGTKITSSTKVKKNLTVYARWQKVTKPKKAGTPSLKSKKNGQLTVSFDKISGVKGYEICYSTKKNFKNARKTTTSKTNATIRKLKRKTVYYVKIRAYKLDSAGKKVYGDYSVSRRLKLK